MARSGEGLGYNNVNTAVPASLAKAGSTQMTVASASLSVNNPLEEYCSGGSFSPIIAPQFSGTGYVTAMDSTNESSTAAAFVNTIAGGIPGGSLQSTANWVTYPQQATNYSTQGNGPNLYCSATGRALAVRSEYNILPQMNGYPDGPNCMQLTSPRVQNQQWTYTTMPTQGYSPKNPYATTYGTPGPAVNNFMAVTPSPCGVSGYIKPVTPEFCLGTN
jgi:hypothetical protein